MMQRCVKVILSLFLSLVISTGFTFFAFTQLFSIIEAGVYYPNLKAGVERETLKIAQKTNAFLGSALGRFQQIVDNDFIWRAYLSRQSDADIEARGLALNQLLREYPNLESVRLLDQTERRINYSTLDTDVASRTPRQLQYKTLDKADPDLAGEKIIVPGGASPVILWDGKRQRIIFCFPVRGPDGKYYGPATFSLKRLALENELVSRDGIIYRDLRVVQGAGLLFDTSGAVTLSGSPPDVAPLEAYCREVWATARNDAVLATVMQVGDAPGRLALFSLNLGGGGSVGVLFPLTRFEMGMTDKILILAVFSVTVFLVILLLANLKQDPIKVVATRMHRFQVEFLREFFEKKDQLDFAHWQKEIDSRRDEIKRYMKRGLKKISSSKETEIDSYIINSWNEVVSVIKSKVQKQPETDLARIEMLLRKVLEEGHVFIAPSGQRAIGRQLSTGAMESRPGEARTADAGGPPRRAPITGLPENEGIADIAELEELEEVEPAEPATKNRAAGSTAGAPRLPGGVKKAVETIAGATAAAGEEAALEELEEIEPLEEVAPATGPSGEEEIESLEILEEEEAATASGAAPLKPRGPEREVAPSRSVGTAAPGKEDARDDLEYLSVVSEIQELPPLPFEKLEELQAVELDQKPNINMRDAYSVFTERVRQAKIRIFDIREMERFIERERGNIVMRDGVYKINEDLYTSAKPARRHLGLKALAQSLLEDKSGGISGIDELYGSKEILEDAERKEIQEKLSLVKKVFPQRKKLLLTSCGLDLDAYMETFAYQVTDKVMIYAIGELIKKTKAVSAILFADDQGLKVNLAIGVTSTSAHLFSFAKDEPLYQDYFSKKKIIVIEDIFPELDLFTGRLSNDDVKFIKSAVFFPALIDHRDAYLFFGLTENETIKDMPTFLKKLEISLA